MQSLLSLFRRSFRPETAAEFKESTELRIAELQAGSQNLSGKEHRTERAAKGRELAALRADGRYIDACRVVRGEAPIHGFFGDESADEWNEVNFEDVARIAKEAEKRLTEVQCEPLRRPPPPPTAELNEDETRHPENREYFFAEEDKLRSWGRTLLQQLIDGQRPVGLSPSEAKEFDTLLIETAELRAELASEGIDDQDKIENLARLTGRLSELRRHEVTVGKKRSSTTTTLDARQVEAQQRALREEVKQLKASVQAHQRRLVDELGFRTKAAKHHPAVQELRHRCSTLAELGA